MHITRNHRVYKLLSFIPAYCDLCLSLDDYGKNEEKKIFYDNLLLMSYYQHN
jgi:hypothetical protein